MPQALLRFPVTSPCSENVPSLLAAPLTSPFVSHFPCAIKKAWSAESPAGIFCWTSGLPHLPDIVVFVCAGVIATTKANTAQPQKILSFIVFSSVWDFPDCSESTRNDTQSPFRTELLVRHCAVFLRAWTILRLHLCAYCCLGPTLS